MLGMSKSKTKIKAILFDLGKVILHFNFDPAFKRLSMAAGIPAEEIEDFFVDSGLEVLYDGGKISSREFYERVKEGLGHSVDFKKFRKIWNEIFTPDPAIVRLIQRLSGQYRLVIISNTNEMHFNYIRKKYPVIRKFDELLLSYQEKLRKPDERFYRMAARACLAAPREIFYIDDRSDLTQAAKALGFKTFTYRNNPAGLRKEMLRLGIQ